MEFFFSLLRALLGISFVLGLAWCFSSNRKAFPWRLVLVGLGLQVVFAVILLRFPPAYEAVRAVSSFFVLLLGFSGEGARFLFGDLAADGHSWGYIFAFRVLPSIIFFAAISAVLYYIGFLQWVVKLLARLMEKTMRLSGAESLAAAANVFIGQTEAPLLVRAYLPSMNRSELFALMTGGMATIAGAVLVAYIGMLGGSDPEQQLIFGTHLLTASLMSAPASLVIAKIMIPPSGEPSPAALSDRKLFGHNLWDVVTRGTSDGLQLALNIGAVLLVFTALVALINHILSQWLGAPLGINAWIEASTDGAYATLSFQWLMGMIFAPMAWLLGVPWQDCLAVGQLLGEKTILNEFFAYATLGSMKADGAITDPRSIIIATYALCGFANLASIGIQISNLSILAPDQRKALVELGLRSLVAGTLACFMTATLAGLLAA